MRYIKPEIDEIQLIAASVFLDTSITPDDPWGGETEPEEKFPEVPLDYDEGNDNWSGDGN